jgi:hypothetical protein
MATSQNPNPARRRPYVGDRSATDPRSPSSADATLDSTDPRLSRPDLRERSPAAGPAPVPAADHRSRSSAEDDGARRQRRAVTAVRDVNDPDIDAALDAVVDTAPSLPHEVRARLVWLLDGQRRQPRRDTAA